MALSVTITSTPGGVGKIPLTANLGDLPADRGQRVLRIDADLDAVIPNSAHREATARVAVHRGARQRSGPTPGAREAMRTLVHALFPHLADKATTGDDPAAATMH